MKRVAITVALLALTASCGSSESDVLVDNNINAIVFLQRQPRTDVGDVFRYESYIPGARLVKLSPPSADGKLEVLCCDQLPEFAEVDISGYDIDFDATRIVFSARLSGDQRYGLFMLDVATKEVEQLPTDPNHDYVEPVFIPGGRIFFMTNAVVEPGQPQFVDEYERRTTLQVGNIGTDGTGEHLGARNLSHRVTPSLMSDGRIMFTQWDHLGSMNAGHLLISSPDMTTVREAYGKEGSGVANSYIKATEIAPGRVVAVATSRIGTIQSGALVDVRLGETYPCGDALCADKNMSEANSSYRILTPLVPRGREPSFQTVGRYYDASAITHGEYPHLLVSWADGPVYPETLEAAGLEADFGVYLFDSKDGSRRPLYNDETMWDVFPRPLVARDSPPEIPSSGKNGYSDTGVLIGSMNVYDSTLATFDPGQVYGVRVLEGFSSEEGFPRRFGLTLHEGSAFLGVAPVQPDGSWAAVIPANIPVHLQTVDVFGMSLKSEPVWISGGPGESRFCGGCHEDRAAVTVIQPGITAAVAAGPTNLEKARPDRLSYAYNRDQIVGVPWGDESDAGALQAIFNAKCVSCHDGDPSKPGNKSITITDDETGLTQTFVFDLSATPVTVSAGEVMLTAYSASHLSLLGPAELQRQFNNQEVSVTIEGDMPIYVEPNDARGSLLMEKLNPPQLYPTYDPAVRAFGSAPIHPADVGGQELTEDEYFALILMADSGGQFYSRENNPNGSY